MDEAFKSYFVDISPEFDDLDHLAKGINEYESITDNILQIDKSSLSRKFRVYGCKHHINCCFRAPFGLKS